MILGNRIRRHQRIRAQEAKHGWFGALATALLIGAAFPISAAWADETAGERIERVANETGKGIRKGVEWAGNGIKRGAAKTGEGIRKGAAYVARGAKKGIEKTGNAISKTGNKIQQAAGDDA